MTRDNVSEAADGRMKGICNSGQIKYEIPNNRPKTFQAGSDISSGLSLSKGFHVFGFVFQG